MYSWGMHTGLDLGYFQRRHRSSYYFRSITSRTVRIFVGLAPGGCLAEPFGQWLRRAQVKPSECVESDSGPEAVSLFPPLLDLSFLLELNLTRPHIPSLGAQQLL